MWKVVFCLLVLLVCLELSVEGRKGNRKHGAKRWKKLSKNTKNGDNQSPWKGKDGKFKKDYSKMSNPEMMMMMRMKKMLSPLRNLFTKVRQSGKRESGGRDER